MSYNNLYDQEMQLLEKLGKSKEYFDNDAISSTIYQNFVDSVLSKDGVMRYPDYYCGAYVDDNGELIVYVTEADNSVLEDLKERFKDDRFKIKHANTPLNQLIEQKNKIMSHRDNTSPFYQFRNILKACAITERKNRIDIFLENLNDEYLLQIRNSIPRNINITFSEWIGKAASQSDLKCGQRVYANPAPEYPGSLAFRARYNGVDGFITAWHVCGIDQGLYDIYGNIVGTGMNECKELDCDASIIRPASGFTPTNKFVDSGDLGLTLHTPVEGQYLNLYGGTSGLISGWLIYSSFIYSDFFGNWSLPAVQYTTGQSQSGDSGGIVYRLIGGIRFACGIHHGLTAVVNPYGQLGTCTDAKTACLKLNATRY